MRRFGVLVALGAAALFVLVFALGGLFDSDEASATHGGTGNGAPNGGHYTLNIIGVPRDKTAAMTGSSRHTLFVPLWTSCKIELVVGDYNVNDGNCTDG